MGLFFHFRQWQAHACISSSLLGRKLYICHVCVRPTIRPPRLAQSDAASRKGAEKQKATVYSTMQQASTGWRSKRKPEWMEWWQRDRVRGCEGRNASLATELQTPLCSPLSIWQKGVLPFQTSFWTHGDIWESSVCTGRDMRIDLTFIYFWCV